MSEQLPETADGAIRAYLFAIGFTLVLVGGDMMAEKDGSRFWIGFGLIVAALPVHLAWVFWQRVKEHLSKTVVIEIGAIAANPRWWLASLFLLLAALIFMPVIQVPRWPSWPFSKTEPATLRTALRLQFNSVDQKPEEIETRNLHWTVARYDEQRKETPDQKYVCDPKSMSIGLNSGLATSSILGISPNCSFVDFPNYHEVINTILFLTFDRPVSAKEIKLNSHGARLPKWDIDILNDKLATIYFHGEMAHMILDVEIVN